MILRKRINILALIIILFLGGWFRFQGLDWDQGYHLQPDERYISLVLTTLRPPGSWREYIDPNSSSLSSYIHGYGAYIYGQLPLTALVYLSRWAGMEGYDRTYLLGRGVSAFLDVLSIVLVFKLGKRLWNEKVGIIGAAFYAFSPLAIQYSHFMTMESWVTFFWLLVIWRLLRLFQESPGEARRLLVRRPLMMTGVIGILLGAAMATKASSVVLVPLAASWIILILFQESPGFARRLLVRRALGYLVILGGTAILSFRFFQPTIFQSASWLDWSLRSDFYQAFNFQRLAIDGLVMFPPQWQWVNTPRWWFPLKNILLWGMGPAAGGPAVIGVIREIRKGRAFFQKARPLFRLALAVWIVAVFIWQGGKFVKNMRYFLPFLPLYALFAASALNGLKRPGLAAARPGLIIISAMWAVMFTNIYRTPTTRVAASEWIYQNIPAGSKIMLEEWDDPLPLLMPGYEAVKYQTEMVGVYAPDDEKKQEQIDRWLADFDWIVLSSPRAKGSIGKLPDEFPLMGLFYRELESGTLGFMKAAEFTSFPYFTINGLRLTINDASAEESFWVYDHPKVEIYKRIQNSEFRIQN